MIRSGEDSGTLSDVLAHVSEYYARELKTVIKTTVSMIEPIMIVLMGVSGRFHRDEHYSADIQNVQCRGGKINDES